MEVRETVKEEYVFTKKELQSLVDSIFEMVYRTGEYWSQHKELKYTDHRDTSMAGVAVNLRYKGIDTKPMGLSWGVLMKDYI